MCYVRHQGCRRQDPIGLLPPPALNPELQKKYQANIFSVVRQLKYSLKNENSLDLVIFINGLRY